MRPHGPVATQDAYDAAATVQGVHGGSFVRVDVFNAAAYVEVAVGDPGRWQGDERFLPPGSHGWPERGASGVRARSAAQGVPAAVTLEIRTPTETG